MSVQFPRQRLQSLSGVLIVLGALLVAACAGQADKPGQPIASPNDDRQYRLLTLDNDMPVLLISDPGTPKAAAALDVMVGSGDNPPGRAGLAHFLEHMLFLGTDKYPDAAEYERFITEHGGNRNAYTAFEHTNYFFDVNAPFLPEALDRFAQFFIAPRFDAEYVQREKNAVEAEYQMGLKSDSRRGLDVLQETMNPDHPFSQFVVGNLESLADRPDSAVRDELIRFYDRHYSANVMRLVVLGAQSLDELEALVVPMFSQVPNKNFEHQRIEVPPFEADRLPLLVQAVPQATLRQLQVSFPIADYRELYAVKPVSYLGNLVGHEGEGSLLSMLKAEGLAESLSAGEGLGWRGGALFSVSIALTAKGVRDYQRVLQLLFAYMDMLREAGPQEWLYGEQARLAELSFRFQEKTEPINYVSALAGAMHDYDDEDVLRGRYMMERFDREALAQLLGSITPDNAIVQLDDKHVSTDRVSTYYQVPYAARTLHADELAAWRSDAAQETLHLPAPNEFIAEDVALVELPAQSPPHPDVVLQTERQKIWFMPDAEFRLPKGATYINFRSVEVGHSARQNAAATLYAALLRDKVNELAYPAQLAGLSFSIYKHAQGISLRMHGYNDKQPRLLRHLLDAFADSTFDERRFADIRQDLIRSLRNSVADRPSSQVMNDLREALLYGEWGETALIAELQQLDQSALRRYARRFWASATAEVMIYGNYDRAIVNDVSKLLASVVQRGPAPALPPVKVLDLAAGEALQYAVAVPHDDAVVAWYLQGADDSWSDRAAADLTAQIVKSGFFQELRTQQQLGYVVAAFSWPQFEVPALVLLVQSPGTAAPEVAQAMQSYLQDVPAGLDRQQFERHRAALLSEILRPDKNLWERAEFYWQSIARKQWDFNGREALAEAVDAFTLDSWLDYYQRVFLRLPHSLQVVAPGRWGLLPAHSERPFTSAEAIKEDHEAYRVD